MKYSARHGSACSLWLGFALIFYVLVRVSDGAQLAFPIQADTYIDSRTSNAAKNYGAAKTVRCVVNATNTSDGSVARGLFMLPPEIAFYPVEQIAQAIVSFYVWQDNTSAREITLYPLTRAFVEGTGSGTAPADGATWWTYDGSNFWTTPGGDYDTNLAVVGVKGPVLDTNLNDRFFYWDVTSLLTNVAVRSNLLFHGALLKIDEDPRPATEMPRAPFTSSDDLSYSYEYRPHVYLVVIPTTANVHSIFLEDDTVVLSATQCTPFVTNRIEYTTDLQRPDGWMFFTNVLATNDAATWILPLPTNASSVFYRLITDP